MSFYEFDRSGPLYVRRRHRIALFIIDERLTPSLPDSAQPEAALTAAARIINTNIIYFIIS